MNVPVRNSLVDVYRVTSTQKGCRWTRRIGFKMCLYTFYRSSVDDAYVAMHVFVFGIEINNEFFY